MDTITKENLDYVISENRNLIYSLIVKYDRTIQDDLFQVGVLGIIDAFKHYDSSKNTKFSTYAYPYINGEIKKFVRENRNIKVSRDIIYLYYQIEKGREMLCQKLNRQPTSEELSTFLGISEKSIAQVIEIYTPIKSIDDPITSDGKELTIKDIVYKSEYYDKLDLISLREELLKLSPSDKELLEKRYCEEYTQEETARMLGTSQVNISRTEKKLMLMLRAKLK
jgi:RNA polymerase sporulation-specific sigma factor